MLLHNAHLDSLNILPTARLLEISQQLLTILKKQSRNTRASVFLSLQSSHQINPWARM